MTEEAASGESGRLRLFVGIALPEEVRAAAARLTSSLSKGLTFGGVFPAWVQAENLHITLVFLGWVDAGAENTVVEILGRVAPTVDAFSLRISGLEIFPSPKNPRVISIGLHGHVDQLKALQQQLAEECRLSGFVVEDREFRPHLTLARIKSMRGTGALRDIVKQNCRASLGKFEVTECLLYRSDLGSKGAKYSVLHSVPLR